MLKQRLISRLINPPYYHTMHRLRNKTEDEITQALNHPYYHTRIEQFTPDHKKKKPQRKKQTR